MKSLALSGWAQYAASLENVLPENAHKIDYGDCTSVEAVFQRISESGMQQPDVAVGWSLGGQLLVRATATGIIQPKHLVLLGAPYQLVANKQFREGKSKMMTAALRLAFTTNADALLNRFQAEFLAQGDCNAGCIKEAAPHYLAPAACNAWLFWLDELIHYSCSELNFGHFTRTSIIHGQNDAVIPYANAVEFSHKIQHSTLYSLPNCGHAPHWHDANFVRNVITGL